LHNSIQSTPNNLPISSTPFIGREKELASTATLLRQDGVRLLTLTGPGGTGKTRLALHLAESLLTDFPDGVFFVGLSPISDPALVVASIAQTLDIQASGQEPVIHMLMGYLRDKRLLLVLDNFEQVLDAATIVSDLVLGASRVKALVTSRSRLRLRLEHEFPVPPLGLPPVSMQSRQPRATYDEQQAANERVSQYEAVRLFIDRAVALKPDFAIDNDSAPAVAEICVRLDGLPLAIELAAARIKMLSPQAILTRLQSRLKLLTGGSRDLLAHQQTLGSAIEWSYDLLDKGEQQLFRRLAVFVGGRTMEAIEAVCNHEGDLEVDVLDGIQSLIDKSLLQHEEGLDGEPRYVMLETIHEYSREKLNESGEGEKLRRLHASYFTALSEEAELHFAGANQAEWNHRLEDERDNLRMVLRWARENGKIGDSEALEMGLRIVGAIWRFWSAKGFFREEREQISDMLLLTSPDNLNVSRSLGILGASSNLNSLRAKALMGAGTMAYLQGDYQMARSLLEEGLQILHDMEGQFKDLGPEEKRVKAMLLNSLGNVESEKRAYTVARSLYERSLMIRRELGDKLGISSQLGNLGIMAYEQGDYALARALLEESLVLRRDLGDKRGVANTLGILGNVTYAQGEHLSARDLHEESLRMKRDMGDRRGATISLAGLGEIAESMNQPERAARLFGAVEALIEAMGVVLEGDDRGPYERGVAAVRAKLGESAFQKMHGEGRAMSLEQAITFALSGELRQPLTSETGSAGTNTSVPKSVGTNAYPGGLSEREVEVLRLVVQGLTDAQVAIRLTISPRTVNRHLSSIYSKLNLPTRTAAALFAKEHGLA
jgi:predicted ATPase/DNA-binding CsgD family transcriptional regulator